MSDKLGQLHRPFHPDDVTFKPGSVRRDGTAALGLAYVGLRAYMDRLDGVFGANWEVSYVPWGEGRIIATVMVWEPSNDGVGGFTVHRSSTGETSNESERNEIGGTVAEAQAFKRACAMLGLGRYLYTLPQVWAEWHVDDPQNIKRGHFTPAGLAQLRKAVLAHYTEETGEQVAHEEAEQVWHVALPQQVRVDTNVVPPGMAVDLGDASEGKDVPFMPDEPAATGALADWARARNVGGRPASEKQLSYLFKQIEFAAGKGSSGALILRQLMGDAPITSTLASAIIDATSKKTKDMATGAWLESSKYDPAIAAAFKEMYNG